MIPGEVIAADGEIELNVGRKTVTLSVANTGDRAGDEVVQLYVRDVLSSVTRPVKELKGFERVTLAPGETKTVSLIFSSISSTSGSSPSSRARRSS